MIQRWCPLPPKLCCVICGNETNPPDQEFVFETDAVFITLDILWRDNPVAPHRICETCAREIVGTGKRVFPHRKRKTVQTDGDEEYTWEEDAR